MNKKNIFITLKKELRSIFRDKKTMFMIFGFPFFIAIFIILMGFMEESMTGEGGSTYKIAVDYEINEVHEELLKQYSLEYEVYDDIKLIKEDFENDLIDGYILFDEVLNTYSIYCDSSISGDRKSVV